MSKPRQLTSAARLTEAIVRQRLASYQESRITDELYDFGKMLMNEALDRVKTLDTKAATIAGYSVGLITLLTATRATWPARFP